MHIISLLHELHNVNLELLGIHLSELFEGKSPAMETGAEAHATLARVYLQM